jgi:branched-subunit amino acid aminotransferase/4-amino-4-deoxychorismate lyase
VQLAEREGVCIRQECLRIDNLFRLDELFVTGTTSDVLPIVLVDGKSIGNGRPGPVAGRLFDAYRRHIGEWLATPSRK